MYKTFNDDMFANRTEIPENDLMVLIYIVRYIAYKIKQYCLLKKLISYRYKHIIINCGVDYTDYTALYIVKKLEESDFNVDASPTCKCENLLCNILLNNYTKY